MKFFIFFNKITSISLYGHLNNTATGMSYYGACFDLKCGTMVHGNFDIRLEGNVLEIERLIYPRLIVRVDYLDPLLPVESVKVLDKAEPVSVKEAVNEIRQYLELMA